VKEQSGSISNAQFGAKQNRKKQSLLPGWEQSLEGKTRARHVLSIGNLASGA
jgi:hypothetical protein